MTGPKAPPDVEEAIVALLGDADTSAEHVGTELEANPAFPCARLTLLPGGGQADGDHEDNFLHKARFQIESFGDPDRSLDGKGDASDLIRELLDVLLADGPGTHGATTISGVDTETDPYWLPDPSDDGPRYLATVAVYYHRTA